MDISIIVCTYNRCESLRKTLDNLKNLKVCRDVSYEVIVVDNNSNDATKTIIEELIRENPFVFRYCFESRQGKSFALNRGISLAQGAIIAFTDDDVSVDSAWLVEIKQAFDRYECNGVGGKIVPVWNGAKPSWFEEDGPLSLYAAIVKLDLGDKVIELQSPAFGANMAFRRAVFDKYGLFREDLGPNPENLIRGEDSEFSWRVIQGGEKFMYVPNAVVYHPVERERAQKEYFQRWYFDYGRAMVRKQRVPKTAICSTGIPRYLIRMLLEQTLRWIFSFNPRQRFYYKLQVYQTAGEVTESFARSK